MKKMMFLPFMLMIAAVIFAGCAKQSAEKETTEPTTKESETKVFELNTDAFADGGKMLVRYANKGATGGENISVPLNWAGAPEGTKSFALVCVDKHPNADNWIHWMVINIPAGTTSIPEGASGTDKMPAGSVELNNTFGTKGYGGPQPPQGTGPHEYEFTLYALKVDKVNLSGAPTVTDLIAAVKPDSLGSAKLTGVYER